MTWDEFYGHVVVVFSTAMEWRGENHISWPHGNPEYYQVTWITGGRSGGNCWGDSAEWDVAPEDEPELDLLIKLMEQVCPDVPMLKYYKLVNSVVEIDSRSDYEYYGNYTTYGIKQVRFDRLYAGMRELGII